MTLQTVPRPQGQVFPRRLNVEQMPHSPPQPRPCLLGEPAEPALPLASGTQTMQSLSMCIGTPDKVRAAPGCLHISSEGLGDRTGGRCISQSCCSSWAWVSSITVRAKALLSAPFCASLSAVSPCTLLAKGNEERWFRTRTLEADCLVGTPALPPQGLRRP